MTDKEKAEDRLEDLRIFFHESAVRNCKESRERLYEWGRLREKARVDMIKEERADELKLCIAVASPLVMILIIGLIN